MAKEPRNRFSEYSAGSGQNRFAQYMPEEDRQKITRVRAFKTGFESGEGWGFRDEAEGAKALRMGENPGFLARAATAIAENPMTLPGFRAGTGVADALTGVIIENTGLSDTPMGERYRAARDSRRDTEKAARKDRPLTYFTGEVTGAMASTPAPVAAAPKGATLSARVASSAMRGAAGGGAAGGVMGFGQGEGDIGDRAARGAEGAVGGAIAGAALNPAFQFVLAPAVSGLAYRMFTPAETKALDMVIRRAERSGTDLKAVRAQFEAWKKTGEVPETLAEMMGPHERQLLSAMITVNRETRERATDVLTERGKKEVDRLEKSFARAMGAGRNDFAGAKAQAAKDRATDPDPFYDFAYFHEIDGRKYRTFFSAAGTKRFANAIKDSEFAIKSIREAADFADVARRPMVRDELREFADAMDKGGKLPKLSVEGADYVERAINARYREAIEKESKRHTAGSLKSLRDTVRQAIDPTGIGEARGVAAERIQRGRLLEEGRKFLDQNVDVEDINAVLRGNPEFEIPAASPEGRANYVTGAARRIADKLRNTSDMKGFADATRSIARTPAIREKIDAVRPKTLTKKGKESQRSKQTRLNRELDEAIDRTARRAEFTVDQLGNSKTAFRMQDVADVELDDRLATIAGEVVEQSITSGMTPALIRQAGGAARRLTDWVTRPGVRNNRINRAASDILLSSGDQIPAQLDRLSGRIAKRLRRGPGGPAPAAPAGSGGSPGGPVRAAGIAPSFRDIDAAITGPAKRAVKAVERRLARPEDPRLYGPDLAKFGVPDNLDPTRPLYDQIRDPRGAAAMIADGAAREGGTPAGQRAIEYVAKAQNERLRARINNADRRSSIQGKTAASRALNAAQKEFEAFFGPGGTHTRFKTQKAKRAEQVRLANRVQKATREYEAAQADRTPRAVPLPPEREQMIIQEILRAERPAGYSTRTQMLRGTRARDADGLRVEPDGQQMPVLPRQKPRSPDDPRADVDNMLAQLLLDPEMATAGAYAARAGAEGFKDRPMLARALGYGTAGAGLTGAYQVAEGVKGAARRQEQQARAREEKQRAPVGEPAKPAKDLWVGLDINNRVRIQSTLNYTNRTQIPLDGSWGEQTKRAISEFQAAQGLPVTGRLDNETLRLLNRVHDRRVYEWSREDRPGGQQ